MRFSSLLCGVVMAATVAVAELVGEQFSVVTYDAKLNALRRTLRDLTALNGDPDDRSTDTHIAAFEIPSTLNPAEFVGIPLMATSVCVAYNNSAYPAVRVDFEQLGAFLLGTASNITMTKPFASRKLFSPSMQLVMAASSPITRQVLRAMKARGVAGFTSATTVPAAMLANPLIQWVATDDAVVTALEQHARWGFVLFARQLPLPCAELTVVDPQTLDDGFHGPTMRDSQCANFKLSLDATPMPTVVSESASYPITGPLYLFIRRNVRCDDGTIAVELMRLFYVDPTVTSSAGTHFAHFCAPDKVAVMRKFITGANYSTTARVRNGICGGIQSVRAGGSSAVADAVSAWAIEWLKGVDHIGGARAGGTLINYTPDGSGSGITGVQQHTHFLAGSDALFSPEEAAAYPTVQFLPAAAFAVSIVFNVVGVEELLLPRCVIPEIFKGTITHWDDRAIVEENPGALLPHQPIHVVAFGTSSGTTHVFTTGLAALEEECTGRKTIAETKRWELPAGTVTTGTSGTVAVLRSTPFTLAYVASSSAQQVGLLQATVLDPDTDTETTPQPSSVSAGLARGFLDERSGAFTIPTATDVYPFVAVSYFLYDSRAESNCSKVAEALNFAFWSLNSELAVVRMLEAGYVPLPSGVRTAALKILEQAKCAGDLVFPHARFRLSGGAVAGLVIGVVAAAVLLAYVLKRGISHYRRFAAVPTDAEKPFTIVFTDIMASTMLWSRCPLVMGESLDLHNQILTNLIVKHNGFQVKTVGDAYMAAFKEPRDAVAFALAAQVALYEADWTNAKEIDRAYKEFVREMIEGFKDGTVVGAQRVLTGLVGYNYDELWRGIRIRIGVHTGIGEIKWDDVVQSYDFFGTVVNTAARVEAVGHGGQIIITDEVLKELGGHTHPVFREAVVTGLGAQQLRGLDEPVTLHQLLPDQFAARPFLPLRLDNEGKLTTSDGVPTAPGTELATTVDNKSERASNFSRNSTKEVADMENRMVNTLAATINVPGPGLAHWHMQLSVIFSTAVAAEKTALIDRLCATWRVGVESDSPEHRQWRQVMGREHYNMVRLAAKTYPVIARVNKDAKAGAAVATKQWAEESLASERSSAPRTTVEGKPTLPGAAYVAPDE